MSIKTELELDPSKAIAQAGDAASKIGKKLEETGAMGPSKSGNLFAGSESGITKLQSGISVLKTGYEGLKKVIETEGAFGDMEAGLASVLPAAADVNEEIEQLIKLAKSPGLEFESVMKAHKEFVQMGKSSAESRDIIRELGNALKLSGADPRQLGSIVDTLVKLDDAGKPNVKMLHSLAQEATGLRQALKAGFGTENIRELEAMNLDGSRFLSSFTAGLKTLGTAQTDLGDKLGDYQDDTKRLSVKIDRWAMEGVEGWVKGIDFLKLKFKEMNGEKVDWKSLYETPDDRHKDPAADAAARAANEEALSKAHDERLAKLQDEISKADDLTAAKQKEMQIVREMALDAPSKAKERAEELKGQQERVDALQLQAELQKSLKQLMADNLLTEKEAIEVIKDRIASQRRASNAQREDEMALKKITNDRQIAARERDGAIDEARSKGHEGKAKRLERSKSLDEGKKAWMNLGLSESEAESKAKDELRRKEDAAYRSEHGGRGRIHSAADRPTKAGGIGSDTYEGVEWSKRNREANETRRLKDDFAFPRIEKMEELRKAQVQPQQPAGPGNHGNDAGSGTLAAVVARLESTMSGFKTLIEPMAKKFAATPLNK